MQPEDAPQGLLRRRIVLERPERDQVQGWVEDDFHHFGVTIRHEDGHVRDVATTTVRAPWSTCAAASVPLSALVGKPLVERASDVGRLLEMRRQCTHLFDLAGLVLAHAHEDRDRRLYEAIVHDRPRMPGSGRPRFAEGKAVLSRDGVEVLAWRLDGDTIVEPRGHAGQSLLAGFREWSERLPPETAEQVFVLRRAVMVAGGRSIDLDRFETAASAPLPPVCYSYQPEVRSQARRNLGSSRDYAAGPEGMLAQARSPRGI